MSSLVKFVEEQFVEKKNYLLLVQEIQSQFITKLERVIKQEHSSLKVLFCKEEVQVQQKLLQLEKCGSIGVERIFLLILLQFKKLKLIKEVKSEEHVFSISEILQVKKQKLKKKIKIRLLTIVNIVGLQQVNFFLKFEQKVNFILN